MQGTQSAPTLTDLPSEEVSPAGVNLDTYVRDLEAKVAAFGARLMAAHTAARGLAESLRVADNAVSAEWCQRQAQTLADATYVWAKGEAYAA